MNHVVLLSNVSPGPACSIPEDKKIFRVSSDNTHDSTGAVPFGSLAPYEAVEATVNGVVEALPLPVPHMYSA